MAVLEGQSNSTETGADLPTQKKQLIHSSVMHLPIPSPHSVRHGLVRNTPKALQHAPAS